MPSSRAFVHELLAPLLVVLVISAFWLYAFPAANLIYVAIIVLHVGLGVVAVFALIPRLIAALRSGPFIARAGWLLMAVAGVLGIVLIFKGTVRAEWNLLYTHIAIAAVASVLLFTNWLRTRGNIASTAGV